MIVGCQASNISTKNILQLRLEIDQEGVTLTVEGEDKDHFNEDGFNSDSDEEKIDQVKDGGNRPQHIKAIEGYAAKIKVTRMVNYPYRLG